MKPALVPILLIVALATAGATESRAEWNGLATPEYTYCYVKDVCTGFCEDWELALQADCSKECDVIGENPSIPCGTGGTTTVSASRDWSVTGKDLGSGSDLFYIELSADGERIDSDTFRVQGTRSQLGAAASEVAVFRFAGDPAVFDGLPRISVSELVEMDIIADDDILLAESDVGNPFLFDVDVAGLANEQIVLMVTAEAISASDVPATGPLGVAGLALIALSLSTVALLRRRRGSTT